MAGLSDKHVGWQIDRINHIDVLSSKHASELLEVTRKPFITFEITLTRIFDDFIEAELRAHFASCDDTVQ